MQTETEAPQGLPEGETAPETAFLNAPETVTEQPQKSEGQDPPEKEPEQVPEKTATKEPEPVPEKPKQVPWFQRRIDDLTREKWDERRRADALQSALDAIPRTEPVEGEQPRETKPAPALTSTDVERRAAELVAANEFNRRCDETYEAGAKAHPDFDSALKSFQLLGGLPPALIEAAQEAGDAHEILYQLGKNPDEAARILGLSPVRMAAAVAKLATAQPTPRPISSAPAPIKPIDGKARGEPDPEKMSMAEWVAWHDKRNTG